MFSRNEGGTAHEREGWFLEYKMAPTGYQRESTEGVNRTPAKARSTEICHLTTVATVIKGSFVKDFTSSHSSCFAFLGQSQSDSESHPPSESASL